MSAEQHDALERLDAWRASGADRIDPVRFRMLDALARRAARYDGATRRVLDKRVAARLAAYAAQVERLGASAGAGAADRVDRVDRVGPAGPLAALNQHIARHALPRAAPWPELAWLDDFRSAWPRISADLQLRQSREQVPTNAGPLNSSSLVHRALSLMREQSPAYLQHFLSYVDALSWLDQLHGADMPAPKEARRTGGAKKGAKPRPR